MATIRVGPDLECCSEHMGVFAGGRSGLGGRPERQQARAHRSGDQRRRRDREASISPCGFLVADANALWSAGGGCADVVARVDLRTKSADEARRAASGRSRARLRHRLGRRARTRATSIGSTRAPTGSWQGFRSAGAGQARDRLRLGLGQRRQGTRSPHRSRHRRRGLRVLPGIRPRSGGSPKCAAPTVFRSGRSGDRGGEHAELESSQRGGCRAHVRAVVAGAASAGASAQVKVLPHGGKVVARIAIPPENGGIAAGEGAVWAMSSARLEADAHRPVGKPVATVTVKPKEPCPPSPEACGEIAAGNGAVWVALTLRQRRRPRRSEDESHRREDPRRTRSRRESPAPRERSGSRTRVDPSVSRIDPATNKVVATIRVAPAKSCCDRMAVGVGGGSVWATVAENGVDRADRSGNEQGHGDDQAPVAGVGSTLRVRRGRRPCGLAGRSALRDLVRLQRRHADRPGERTRPRSR